MQAPTFHDPYLQGLELSAANRHFEAIECFEEALERNPRDIRVLFALGNTAAALGMSQPAQNFYRQVLGFVPDRMEALVNLANLLRTEGQFDAAKELLLPALSRNPAAAELQLTLGSVYRETGDIGTAAEHYRAALALRPDYSEALANLADILADRGEMEDALALYDHVVESEPANAQIRLNRAVLHLLNGNLPQGWRDYAARLDIRSKVPAADPRFRRWNGMSLENIRLLVRAEQGVGDQIMFASMIPELAARAERERGKIVLECERRLVSLFARSFPRVAVRPCVLEARDGVTTASYDWLKQEGDVDVAIELGTLPRLMRGDIALFPNPHVYLAADRQDTEYWRDRFRSEGPAPRIGISWRSGAQGGARALQYAPLRRWAEFLRSIPGTIVCAQYGANPEELYQLETLSGRKIFNPAEIDQKRELDRTCAMLSALDAVVSAPTAVSWLAAAAGVTTFKILYDTSWTSFGKRYEPFAPSALLMMPENRGDWPDAFARASKQINTLFAGAWRPTPD